MLEQLDRGRGDRRVRQHLQQRGLELDDRHRRVNLADLGLAHPASDDVEDVVVRERFAAAELDVAPEPIVTGEAFLRGAADVIDVDHLDQRAAVAGHRYDRALDQARHGCDERRVRTELHRRLENRPRDTGGLEALFAAAATRQVRTRLGAGAVDATEVDDPPRAGGRGGLREGDDAVGVDVVVAAGRRLLVTRDGGAGDDRGDALAGSGQRGRIAEIADDQLGTRRDDRVGPPGHGTHGQSGADEAAGQAAADEAGRAGDENGCFAHVVTVPCSGGRRRQQMLSRGGAYQAVHGS